MAPLTKSNESALTEAGNSAILSSVYHGLKGKFACYSALTQLSKEI